MASSRPYNYKTLRWSIQSRGLSASDGFHRDHVSGGELRDSSVTVFIWSRDTALRAIDVTSLAGLLIPVAVKMSHTLEKLDEMISSLVLLSTQSSDGLFMPLLLLSGFHKVEITTCTLILPVSWQQAQHASFHGDQVQINTKNKNKNTILLSVTTVNTCLSSRLQPALSS